MAVQAELLAVSALREYLLANLPAKVATVNAARAVRFVAPYAGPYTVGADDVFKVGTLVGGETTVPLSAGSISAEDLAAAVTLAEPPDLTASSDSAGRLVLTSFAPAVDDPSVITITADAPTLLASMGLSAVAFMLTRSALVAPGYAGFHDGDANVMDFNAGFGLVVADRSTSVYKNNPRTDTHEVRLNLDVLAAEPEGKMQNAVEYLHAAVQCVREVILADRTLGGAVQLCNVETVRSDGRTFRFQIGTVSPLYSSAQLILRVLVFERS